MDRMLIDVPCIILHMRATWLFLCTVFAFYYLEISGKILRDPKFPTGRV